jgi:hypothetical protein
MLEPPLISSQKRFLFLSIEKILGLVSWYSTFCFLFI